MSDLTQAKRIFAAALEVAAPERAAFLDDACRGDAPLREQVERLLHAYRQASGFLDQPTGGALPAGPDAAPAPPGEQPGDRIDRYKLLQSIGEGGMGTVWMAEQLEPVRRKVALKVVKLGMDTKGVVARFEAERQALALMDHPHIAKVLDGGATEHGRPYFVMELVKGVPITEFCDQANLEHKDRLRLFQQVCQAVQHAHHKGVVHRDLKPGNVLVTLHDGVPVPKVIDFGIAKATSRELTEKTLFTEFRQMVGTPEYMAPEQAELSGLDVDTRADVYSLGVLLYELLTGTRPFELGEILGKGYAEMLRVIQEDDPPKPSTRISTLGATLAVVARRRHTTPQQLTRLVRGDLDWIVMRALEKDRGRRYATASDLAADVGRHLDGQAVHAAPPSTGYRVRKYVSRHRVAVVAATAVLLALLLGAAGTALGWLEATEANAQLAREVREKERQRQLAVDNATRADEQARRATAGEELAQRESARLAAVMELVEDMLGADLGTPGRGSDYTVRQLLDDFDRGLGDRLADTPAVEQSIRKLLAQGYYGLGHYDRSNTHALRALELSRRLFADSDDEVASVVAFAAHTALHLDDFDGAERMLREQLADPKPDSPLVEARLLTGLACVLDACHRYAEAEPLARRALALYRAEPTADPAALALCVGVLAGICHQDPDNSEEALPLLREELAILRDLHPGDHRSIAWGLSNLSWLLWNDGQRDEAERSARDAIRMFERLYGPEHIGIARARVRLGHMYRDQLRLADAEREYLEAYRLQCQFLSETHSDNLQVLAGLAFVMEQQSRLDEAAEYLRRAAQLDQLPGRPSTGPVGLQLLANVADRLCLFASAEEFHRREIAQYQHPAYARTEWMARAQAGLGKALRQQARYTEAEPAYADAVSIYEQLDAPSTYWFANTRFELAELHLQLGRTEEALVELRRTADLLQQPRRDGDVAISLASVDFAVRQRLAELTSDPAESELLLRDLLRDVEQLMPGHPNVLVVQRSLAVNVLERGRPDEAAALCEPAYEGLHRIYGPDHREPYLTSNVLAMIRQQQGRLAEAVALQQEACRGIERVFGSEHPWLARAWQWLAALASQAAEHGVAIAALQKVLAHPTITDPVEVAETRHALVIALWLQGDHEQAATLGLELLPAERLRLADSPARIAGLEAGVGYALLALGRHDEAEPILRRCLTTREREMHGSWLHYNAMSLLGGALLARSAFAEAEPLLLTAAEELDPPPVYAVRRIEAIERLVQLYERWERPEQAARWRAELDAERRAHEAAAVEAADKGR